MIGIHGGHLLEHRPRPKSNNPGPSLPPSRACRQIREIHFGWITEIGGVCIVLEGSCSGSNRVDLLSKPVLRSSNPDPPYLPPGLWSSSEGRIPGRIEAKLLSNSVSVQITQARPCLPPGRGVDCWSDDFETRSVFEYADMLRWIQRSKAKKDASWNRSLTWIPTSSVPVALFCLVFVFLFSFLFFLFFSVFSSSFSFFHGNVLGPCQQHLLKFRSNTY